MAATDDLLAPPGDAVPVPDADEAPADIDGDDAHARGERRFDRLVLLLLLTPLVTSAVALVVGVGGSYLPASDHALTELQVRDVGRHEVLVGLYSRADWNHPGPALFYLLAPFYRLAGGASIGMNLGALAINAGALAGIVVVARRHGSRALGLTMALGLALLVRSLGAEFVHDPWNCFVTALPFGLVVMLAWAMACGDRWALPVGAAVATGVAQAHVGFVALALPLVAGGALVLAVRSVHEVWPGVTGATGSTGATGATDDGPRGLLRRGGAALRASDLLAPVLVTAGVLALLWLPALVDVVQNSPSNLNRTFQWFREGEEGVHGIAEGLRVVTGQFGFEAEWLGGKQTQVISIESPFLRSAPIPWLLVPAAVAGVVLWRQRGNGRFLVVTLVTTLALSVAAVSRTVGPAFDYRLRWTWVPATLVAAVTVWVAGRAIVARRPDVKRYGEWGLLAALVVVTGVNTFTAATAGTPQGADSAALAELMPAVRDEVEGVDGQVVVTDMFSTGSWFARGVVLQLERAGVDARVPSAYARLFGERRVVGGEGDLTLVVGMNEAVETLDADPDLRRVAFWTEVPDEAFDRADEQQAALDDRLAAGEIDANEHALRSAVIDHQLSDYAGATAYQIGVYAEEPEDG